MAFPTLATTFAEASRALGFRPLYAEDGASRALVLMRGLSAPVIGPWTRRAKVNVESTDVAFATELVKVIRHSSPALVRWGDHYWPPAPAVLDECPGMRPVVRHIIEQDLTRDEDALFRGMKDEIRRKIRRASKDGVVVSEVASDADLRDYCRLSPATNGRTEAPAHPHYSVYAFKRMWGGTLSEMTSGEIVLSRLKLAFQDRVLSPLWEREYPIYLHGVKSADVKRVLLSALPGLETRIFRRLARQRS